MGGPVDPHRHRPLLGELEGVREQVLQDLLDAVPVGGDVLGEVVGQGQRVGQGLLVGDGAESLRQLVGQVGDPHRRHGHVELAGFHLGQVEDVADQVEQVVAGVAHRPGELHLLGGEVPLLVVGQQLGQDQQAVERCPQLVAHVGQELGLVLRGQRQLGGLLLQPPTGQLDLAVLGLDVAVALLELGV